MNFCVLFSSTLLSVALLAQGQVIKMDPDQPNDVMAIVNGKPLTQAEFLLLYVSMDAKTQEALKANPTEYLKYYGFLDKLASMAENEKLQERDPYKTKLRLNRLQIMSEAMMQQFDYTDIVTAGDQERYYRSTIDKYTEAKVKLIYLAYTSPTEELKAKQKAEEITAKLKKGADFIALVKEFSQDKDSRENNGDYPPVKRSDDVPEAVKSAIFSLKKGEISPPTKLPNGYYIFRMEDLAVKDYKLVKDDIYKEVKQDRQRNWLNSIRSQVDVKPPTPPAKTN